MDKQVWTINNYRRRTCSQGEEREEGGEGRDGKGGGEIAKMSADLAWLLDCLVNWFIMSRLSND